MSESAPNPVGAVFNRDRRRVPRSPIRRLVAPLSPQSLSASVQSVSLVPGEDVEWTWTHTSQGSYVSGYTIIGRPRLTKGTKRLADTLRPAYDKPNK